MRFLLDENVDTRLALFLRQQGHNVSAIVQDYVRALDDHEVLGIAALEQRVLITDDLDFGELVVRERLPHAGVVLFRLGGADLQTKQDRLQFVLRNHVQDLMALVVVTARGVRVRQTENGDSGSRWA